MKKKGNVKICLKVIGKKKQKAFKIVVLNYKKKKPLDYLGYVKANSLTKDYVVGVNFIKFYKWFKDGAIISPSLFRFIYNSMKINEE